MQVLTIDVECSKLPNIYPWMKNSFLSAVGLKVNSTPTDTFVFVHDENKEHDSRAKVEALQRAVDKADLIVGANLKFDLIWLKSIGIKFRGQKFFCTQVAEYMLRGQRKGIGYGLDVTAKRYHVQGKTDKVKAYWDNDINTDKIPLRILLPYLKQDCDITYELYLHQAPLIKSKGLAEIADVCFETTNILADIENAGFSFNKDEAQGIVAEYQQRLEQHDEQLQALAGFEFNPSSNQQLSVALYGGVLKSRERVPKVTVLKSGKEKVTEVWKQVERHVEGLKVTPISGSESAHEGYYATNKDILKALRPSNQKQSEFIDLLLERSNTQKVLQTFYSERKDSSGLLNVIGMDGRVHPQFNQTVTATGRLSSSKPNGQNLPRKGTSPIKKTVISRNGRILNVDLAQIEWRMAAELSRDSMAVTEICANIDAHGDNAIRLFGAGKYSPDSLEFNKLRTDAKIFLFRMIYGGSANGFFRDRKMPDFTLEEWKSIVDKFREKYEGLVKWQQQNIAEVLKTGMLTNFTGRILTFPKVQKYDGSFGPSEQAVCNYPVQSISADIYYIALVELMRRLREEGCKSELILLVHDSMVFDAYEDEIDLISRIAVEVFESLPSVCERLFGRKFAVPLTGDVEVGLTYGDIVKYTVYTANEEKLLYSFKEKGKTNYMWVIKEEDIFKKHPQATELKVVDKINPSRR